MLSKKILIVTLILGGAACQPAENSNTTTNWEKIDESVDRLYTSIYNNLRLISLPGRATGGPVPDWLEIITKAAYTDVLQIVTQAKSAIKSQTLNIPMARQYHQQIHNRIDTLVTGVKAELSEIPNERFAAVSENYVIELLKSTFDQVEVKSQQILDMLRKK